MNAQSFRLFWLGLGSGLLLMLAGAAAFAPTDVSALDFSRTFLPMFSDGALLGTDDRGIPLSDYAMQGARIVLLPAIVSGIIVSILGVIAGLSRAAGLGWVDGLLQAGGELVGALPRMVVVLVVAIGTPSEWRSLFPIGLTWALLAAPGAMDEAAATAGRLGGTRFVEALRAHGFSAFRIYVYHIIWLNLRPVLVRQGAEVMMQVVFLEIALSYLVVASHDPALTHSETTHSWASILYLGYRWLIDAGDLMHALGVGVAMVAVVAVMAQSFRLGARAR